MSVDLTPPEHEHSEAVGEAARWLVALPAPPSPIVPALCKRFGLTIVEACAAAREAGLVRGRAN